MVRTKPRWLVGLVVSLVAALTMSSTPAATGQDQEPLTYDEFLRIVSYVSQHLELSEAEVAAVFGGDLVDPDAIPTEIHTTQRRFSGNGGRIVDGFADLANKGALPPNIKMHNTGEASFFSTSASYNMVLVSVPKGLLECTSTTYRELALFELYPADFVIQANPLAPGDPGVGAASAFSLVCAQALLRPFFGIADASGMLAEFASPIGILEIGLPGRSVFVFITPRNVPLRPVVSGAPDLTGEPRVDQGTYDELAADAEVANPDNVPINLDLFTPEMREFYDLVVSSADVASPVEEPVDPPDAIDPGDEEVDEPSDGTGVNAEEAVIADSEIDGNEADTDASEPGSSDDTGGLPLGLLAIPLVIGGIVVGTIVYARRRSPVTGKIELSALEPFNVGRSSTVAQSLVERFRSEGRTAGRNGLFVPTFDMWDDALDSFPDGDEADIFLLRGVAEHVTGREVGSSLTQELRERTGIGIGTTTDPTRLAIAGALPHTVDMGMIVSAYDDNARIDIPKDRVLVVHEATGQLYWLPLRDLDPGAAPELGRPTLASVSDEVVCL